MPQRPPGPAKNQILGDIKAIRHDTLGYLSRNARDYPGISRVKVGLYNYINLTASAYIEHVLRNRETYVKGRDNRSLEFLVGNGLLTSSGDFWLKQRRLMQPLFHHKRLQGFVESMVKATQNLARDWEARQDDHPLDIHAEMTRITLDVVSATLLSTDVKGDFKQISESVQVLMEGVFSRTQSVLRLPFWVPIPRYIRMHNSRKLLNETVYKIIEHRRQSNEQFDDLLTMLMEVEDADTAERMTDAQLRDEVITIFIAGHETTANALTFAFYLLAQHPEVKEKVEQEVNSVIGNTPLTFSYLNELAYTKQVIEEAMRLYPPAWAIVRQAAKDDLIEGWRIKKGDNIIMSPYLVHRLSQYWDQPEAFNPERFHPANSKNKPRYSYFPFGGGQRLCIGNNFAMMEMQVILALLCQRFDFILSKDFQLRLEPLITLRPKDGIPMYIKSKEDSEQ